MKRLKKLLLWGFCLGIGLVLAVCALFVFWMNSDDSQEEIGKPYSEMLTTGMPFSAKTREIHYFIHAGGMQELELYCKFNCDSSEAETIADDFMDRNEARYIPLGGPRPRTVTTAAPFRMVGHERFPKLMWWDLDHANVFKEIRVDASHGYTIWIAKVDEVTSRIYVFELD